MTNITSEIGRKVSAAGLDVQNQESKVTGMRTPEMRSPGMQGPLPLLVALSNFAWLRQYERASGMEEVTQTTEHCTLLVKTFHSAQTWLFSFFKVQINIKHQLI